MSLNCCGFACGVVSSDVQLHCCLVAIIGVLTSPLVMAMRRKATAKFVAQQSRRICSFKLEFL